MAPVEIDNAPPTVPEDDEIRNAALTEVKKNMTWKYQRSDVLGLKVQNLSQ